MRKEFLAAVIIGFIIGLIIVFGVYTANRAVSQKKQMALPSPVSSILPSPSPVSLVDLQIIEPQNNIVVNKSKINLSGRTASFAFVAVMAEDFEEIFQADKEGLFSLEVPLTSGANEIKIVSWQNEEEKQEKTLMIVYSTAEI